MLNNYQESCSLVVLSNYFDLENLDLKPLSTYCKQRKKKYYL